MAEATDSRVLANGATRIDFATEPARYRHWRLTVEGEVATLTMDVDENAGLFEGYQLKLNSYDLGVDIELADAVQRLRFEYPQVKVVLLRSAKNRVFCAGANIRMLAGATHAHKVNFCKFTNETRNGFEDSSENSGQRFITVVNGTAAGGGYELALATDYIIMADDGAADRIAAGSAATRGAARHRRADPRGRQAQGAPRPCRRVLHHRGRHQGQARGASGGWSTRSCRTPSSKPRWRSAPRPSLPLRRARASGQGIALTPLPRSLGDASVRYRFVSVDVDRDAPDRDTDNRRRRNRAACGRRWHGRARRIVLAAAAGA